MSTMTRPYAAPVIEKLRDQLDAAVTWQLRSSSALCKLRDQPEGPKLWREVDRAVSALFELTNIAESLTEALLFLPRDRDPIAPRPRAATVSRREAAS